MRRGLWSAWIVFAGMAGTTMAFQVYHSVEHGHMPWPLAYLYGIVPLAISMLVIEFVSEWKNAPKWASVGAYLITAGSMYLSAAATGAVVFRAAPAHSSLLFGLLLDAAAILAVRYLIAGPKQAEAAAEAERQAELAGERKARLDAEAETSRARREAAAEAERIHQEAAETVAAAVAERDQAVVDVEARSTEISTLTRQLAEVTERASTVPALPAGTARPAPGTVLAGRGASAPAAAQPPARAGEGSGTPAPAGDDDRTYDGLLPKVREWAQALAAADAKRPSKEAIRNKYGCSSATANDLARTIRTDVWSGPASNGEATGL
jgi:hypothetical protein